MNETTSAHWYVGSCSECGQPNKTIGPLHGAQGGPMFCLQCGMDWHGKHGRRRKVGRIVVKAMTLFFSAGGTLQDIDELCLRAASDGTGLGQIFGWTEDTIGSEVGDLTSELLDQVLRLTHPDVHPPERQELATRVTADLTTLRPFVFPAPKQKPIAPEDERWEPTYTSRRDTAACATPPAPVYPCAECCYAIPFHYCASCRAEWTRRHEKQLEAQRQKERAWYRARKERQRRSRRIAGRLPLCAECQKPFELRRKDAKYCKPACRQRAHRRRRIVTDKNRSRVELRKSHNEAQPAKADAA